MTVTLYNKKKTTDVIKLRILRRNHMYPCKRETVEDGKIEQRERELKIMALKTGVIQPHAKEGWQPSEAGRGEERTLP